MDNLTTLPMDWKPLVEAAEAYAREAWAANVRRFEENGWSTVELHGGDEYAMEGLRVFSLAQADLLADLTRPASRDFWARWLAERVGLTVGATAPVWVPIKGMDPSTIWSLSVRSGIDMDASPSVKVDQRGFVEPGAFPDSPIATVVPGISTLTDPAAALRVALLAVVLA